MARARSDNPLRAIFSFASAHKAGSISIRVTSVPATRESRARLAAPTPAPSSSRRSPACAGTAAASRIASCPKRWPRLGCSRRSRPFRIASSVISGALAPIGAQLVAETGIGKQFARLGLLIVGDEDAPRQHPDRAFQHAHILVEYQVCDMGAVK